MKIIVKLLACFISGAVFSTIINFNDLNTICLYVLGLVLFGIGVKL